jgi:hypothetical protein
MKTLIFQILFSIFREECKECSKGHFCDTIGMSTEPSTAQECPTGFYCLPGTVIPTKCDAGSFTASSKTECQSLLFDWLPNDNCNKECEICPAGQFCLAGTSIPSNCPSGHYCPTGTQFPLQYPCQNGTFSASGSNDAQVRVFARKIWIYFDIQLIFQVKILVFFSYSFIFNYHVVIKVLMRDSWDNTLNFNKICEKYFFFYFFDGERHAAAL